MMLAMTFIARMAGGAASVTSYCTARPRSTSTENAFAPA